MIFENYSIKFKSIKRVVKRDTFNDISPKTDKITMKIYMGLNCISKRPGPKIRKNIL